MSDIESRVREIICEQLGVSEDEVKKESSFMHDLGADSLDIVELIISLETEFEIDVPDEDAEKIATVQDVIDYIEKSKAK